MVCNLFDDDLPPRSCCPIHRVLIEDSTESGRFFRIKPATHTSCCESPFCFFLLDVNINALQQLKKCKNAQEEKGALSYIHFSIERGVSKTRMPIRCFFFRHKEMFVFVNGGARCRFITVWNETFFFVLIIFFFCSHIFLIPRVFCSHLASYICVESAAKAIFCLMFSNDATTGSSLCLSFFGGLFLLLCFLSTRIKI